MKSGLDLLAVAQGAAERAAEYIRAAGAAEPPERRAVLDKGHHDWATEVDHDAERLIAAALRKATPDAHVMAEEATPEMFTRGLVWVVDPLDGTTNFLHGIPHFAISIGLERDCELVAGLIYNPATNETFTAERGKGAFLNDRRIRVAARSELADSVIVTGIPHRGKPDQDLFLKEMASVMAATSGVRRTGAAALDLAWVAAGRFDADPQAETVAVFGYGGRVQLLTRRPGMAWEARTLFEDIDRGHWLAAAELDGRNGTDELLCTGYSGRIVLLARPPGYALPGTATDPDG